MHDWQQRTLQTWAWQQHPTTEDVTRIGRQSMNTEERPQRVLHLHQVEPEGAGINDASKAEERSATVPSHLEGSPLIFGLGEEEEEEQD